MSSRFRLLPALVAAGMVFAACSSAATPVPTVAPSATAAATKITDGTLPKPELAALKLGASIQEPSQFAPKLAEMAGIYEKYGLKVTVTTFNADGDALQAMLSGQTDVGDVSASGLINSQLTDSPATQLTVQKVKVIDGMFCSKDIKTAADMKGKSVAVSTLGGTAHASVLLALDGLKLTEKDVLVTAVGGQAVRVAALKGGSIACAPVGMDLAKDLTGLGFNLLIDLSKSDLPYPSTGLAALNTWLKKNPNTALVVTAANLEAQNMIWTDPQKAAGYWATYAQIDQAKALTLITGAQDQLQRSLRWTLNSFQFTQKVMAIVTPGIMTVDPTKAMDLSYLQKLEDIGFYKKINNPLP